MPKGREPIEDATESVGEDITVATVHPGNKTARLRLIEELISSRSIGSQSELQSLLRKAGVTVAQPTLSRDLVEIGAIKRRSAEGMITYALADAAPMPEPIPLTNAATSRLQRACKELLTSAAASANLVVLQTPPGAAQYFASAIDHAVLSGMATVLGTIAGDDTVLVICTDADGGAAVADQLLAWADRRRA